jgi:hypothetical protein
MTTLEKEIRFMRLRLSVPWLGRVGAALLTSLVVVLPAAAQDTQTTSTPMGAPPQDPAPSQAPPSDPAAGHTAPADQKQPDGADKDREDGISAVQPDFTVVNERTTLALPKFGSAFRVTHRFTRPLDEGDFGSLAEDFFGFDGGAQIGLEYRFGIWTGAQVGIYRTSDRTIQLFGQYNVLRQGTRSPVGIAALLAVDGTNNFRDDYSPTVGAIVSRTVGQWLALYAEPSWVGDTNAFDPPGEDDSTVVLGLSTRVRVRPTVYGVLEVVPRLGGHSPGDPAIAFGIEKRAGGHVFQINFSNSIGTTVSQTLRGGGASTEHWYIGYNISRKFY